MVRRTKLPVAHALLALLLLMGAAPALAAEKPPARPCVGKSLEGLRLFDLAGRSHEMADVQEKCVVVVFWAFWCDTWKKSLPALTALNAERKQLGVAVWSISIDGRYTAEARPAFRAGRIPFPALVDDGALARRLQIRRVPTVVLLDEHRRIVWAHEGYPGNEALEAAIRKVVGDPKQPAGGAAEPAAEAKPPAP